MGPVSFFCMWLFSLQAPFVEKTVLSPLNGLGTLVDHSLLFYIEKRKLLELHFIF